MKITNDKISSLVKSVLRGGTAERSHDLIHPDREWLVGLLVFLFVALGAGWWAASLYVRFVDPSSLMSEEVVVETATFRPAQIEAALAVLKERAVRYDQAEAVLRGGDIVSAPVVEVGSSTEVASSTAVMMEAEVAADDIAEPEVVDDTPERSLLPGDESPSAPPELAN